MTPTASESADVQSHYPCNQMLGERVPSTIDAVSST
jgi:hypothetical protein